MESDDLFVNIINIEDNYKVYRLSINELDSYEQTLDNLKENICETIPGCDLKNLEIKSYFMDIVPEDESLDYIIPLQPFYVQPHNHFCLKTIITNKKQQILKQFHYVCNENICIWQAKEELQKKMELSTGRFSIFFKGEELDDKKTIKDYNIKKFSNIYIHIASRENAKIFADISKGNITLIPLSKNADKWRCVSKGMNIFGICINDKCEAFNKEVIYMHTNLTSSKKKNMETVFDFKSDHHKTKCPICSEAFESKTCGFLQCEYAFIGTKLEKGKIVHFGKPKYKRCAGEKFEYFSAEEKNQSEWLNLKIFSREIDNFDAKSNLSTDSNSSSEKVNCFRCREEILKTEKICEKNFHEYHRNCWDSLKIDKKECLGCK